MFNECRSLTSIKFGPNFKANEVELFSRMFRECYKIQSLDLSMFRTIFALQMDSMFLDCKELTSIKINSTEFNTQFVTTMNEMFKGCSKLTSFDFSKFDTTKVENMDRMFGGCSAITSLDLGSFNSKSLITMDEMFNGCANVADIKFSENFNVEYVEIMTGLFRNNARLTSIDLSMFKISRAYSLAEFFQGCEKLETITFSSKFDTSVVTNMISMFSGCKNLQSISLSTFKTCKYESNA